jgi:hypothetical protein
MKSARSDPEADAGAPEYYTDLAAPAAAHPIRLHGPEENGECTSLAVL